MTKGKYFFRSDEIHRLRIWRKWDCLSCMRGIEHLKIGTSIDSGILHWWLREQVPFKWLWKKNNYYVDAEVPPLRADWRDGWIIQVIRKPPLIFLIWSSEERNGKRANSQEKHTAIKGRFQQRQDHASCYSWLVIKSSPEDKEKDKDIDKRPLSEATRPR